MICSSKEFKSDCIVIGEFKKDFTQDQIKNEPMFFNSSIDYAYNYTDSLITKSFIDSLPNYWHDGVLDSRVHMLMKGWYPAIPGFHHDDVPRNPIPVGQHFITAGQPNYENPRYHSEHVLGLINAEICPTVFAIGNCKMPAIQDYELIYRKWHEEVEKLLKIGELSKFECESGKLYQFDWQSFHSGQKAIAVGWRWFCRVTKNSDRCKSITNEVRKQVQVYLEFPMEGW